MGENYFGVTDPGRQRTNNEDSFIVQTVFNKRFILACVIDGVGGYEGGEIAARLTRDEIIRKLRKVSGNITDQMVSALDTANERIIREKEESPQNEKMACVVTLAIVDIENNVFYFAHVGDTRLYLSRDGSLIKITRDHSSVGFLEESGRLTEEAAMAHPKRNEVNKVLGYEKHIAGAKDFIDTGESPFLPGDTILLCSDGLTDMITTGQIISILNSKGGLQSKGPLLVNAANDAGGRDNITVVLVSNDKSRVQHEVTKPLTTIKKPVHNVNGDTQIIETNAHAGKYDTSKNSGTRINTLLVILCILFFLGFLWLFFRDKKPNTKTEIIPVKIAQQRNKDELIFLDSVKASLNGVVHLTGGQTIVVTDTLPIKNDSLHIIGNGVSFVRDSSYDGPAFLLSPAGKYILFDSVNIENFNIGILVPGNGLHLKNVCFKNCRVPMVFQQQLKGSMVSGKQAENIFYFTDSLHK